MLLFDRSSGFCLGTHYDSVTLRTAVLTSSAFQILGTQPPGPVHRNSSLRRARMTSLLNPAQLFHLGFDTNIDASRT
jgi:hypothetical protein